MLYIHLKMKGSYNKHYIPIFGKHLQIFVYISISVWAAYLYLNGVRTGGWGGLGKTLAADKAWWPSLSPSDLWEGNNELWVAVILTVSDSLAMGTSVLVAWKGLCCFPTSDFADRCGVCWLPCSYTSPPFLVVRAAATDRADISFNDLLGIYTIKNKKLNRNRTSGYCKWKYSLYSCKVCCKYAYYHSVFST